MSAENIKAKALKCIDEIYPSADPLNDTYFPVDDFLGEAVRWVIDIVPPHIFTTKKDIIPTGWQCNGEIIKAPRIDNIGRITYFKHKDWERPADIIYENSLLYRQQKNRVLRGNPSRPIVVRMMNGGLEVYTAKSASLEDIVAYNVPYEAEYIPEKAEDLCAWKLAEIVLMSMSDAQNAAVCTARVNELLEQIVL
jgi:hypothetical protein